MSDALFYIVIIVVALVYLSRASRRRAAALRAQPAWADGARVGPLPGYSYMPGEGVRFDPLNPPPPGLDERWKVLSAETAHAGKRLRLVFTIEADGIEGTELFTLMRSLAQRLQHKTRFHAVAVEVMGDGSPRALIVLAADGRGWTGTTQEAAITAELPERSPFRLAARGGTA